MKKAHILLLAVLLVFFGTACSPGKVVSSNYKDAYVENEDFNPTANPLSGFRFSTVTTDEGIFFNAGAYLFYMDYTTRKAVPLCSKPECMHQEETDARKILNCDAYIGAARQYGHFIAMFKDKLYVTILDPSSGDYNLVEMNSDGSERSEIMKGFFSRGINYICMHRGVIYFDSEMYSADGDPIIRINAISLVSGRQKPAVIYEATEKGVILNGFMPYKNKLYMVFFTENHDERSQEFSLSIWIEAYDILTGETVRLPVEDMNICGAFEDKLTLVGQKGFYEYDTLSQSGEFVESGLALFYREHEDWQCMVDLMDEDLSMVAALKTDTKEHEAVEGLMVVDSKGNLLGVIQDNAWGRSTGAIIRIHGEEYYMRYMGSSAPFSICLFKKEDLLNGNMEPETIFYADDLNDLQPGYIISNE